MDKKAKKSLGIAALLAALLLVIVISQAILAQSPSVSYSLVTEPIEGVAYTSDCLVECHLPLRITFQNAYSISSADKFSPKLEKGKGTYEFDSLEFRRLVDTTEDRIRWVPDVQCTKEEQTINETPMTVENCVDKGHQENYKVDVQRWEPFTSTGFAFEAGKEYQIELVGKRKDRL